MAHDRGWGVETDTDVETPEADEAEPTDGVSDVPIGRFRRALERLFD